MSASSFLEGLRSECWLMKFGVHYDLRNPIKSGRRTPELYKQTLEQIRLAEQLGLDDVWLSEHHFVDDGYLPSLLPFAGAVAAQTDGLMWEPISC